MLIELVFITSIFILHRLQKKWISYILLNHKLDLSTS